MRVDGQHYSLPNAQRVGAKDTVTMYPLSHNLPVPDGRSLAAGRDSKTRLCVQYACSHPRCPPRTRSWMGKGVSKAVENINKVIGPAVVGMNPIDQKAVDEKMFDLDGTDNKGKLGANAILAVSMATVKVGLSGAAAAAVAESLQPCLAPASCASPPSG